MCNREDEDQLSNAADQLYVEYISDKELTTFTTLDSEDFYKAKQSLFDKS